MVPAHIIRNPQSPREEIFNWLSHGIALVLSLIGLGALLVLGGQQGWSSALACAVYGASLVALFGASTFYHASAHGPRKQFGRMLDHCAIFLLISGTYTPLMTLALGGWKGWAVLVAVWLMGAYGIYHKMTAKDPFGPVGVVLCLLMGWLLMLVWNPMVACAPVATKWLLAGGAAYTLGVPFYGFWRNLPYNHGIWHLFVMAGAGCHYVAVLHVIV